MSDSPLTHFDASGQAHMVDVGAKAQTHRITCRAGPHRHAAGDLRAGPARQPEEGRRAGRGAAGRHHGRQAHRRPDPALCHPIALTRVAVEFELLESEHAVVCRATAETVGQTGVEMEAR